MEKNILFGTKKCLECDGWGTIKDISDKEIDCPMCSGAGVRIDNRFADLIKRYNPLINRRDFISFLKELAELEGDKLADAYQRGERENVKK
jgi:hypothetical protein